MTGLFHAHSGLRYLVLLAGLVAALFFLYGLLTRRPSGKGEKIAMAVFTGTLDLQILLGIVMVAMGNFYGALMGHLFMMLLAGVTAHVAGILARRTSDDHRAHGLRLGGVLIALLLIVGGILAIGRSVLGAGVPSMTS